jgi:hypothetical protein
MTSITYDNEDAARVAELCLAAGCAEAISRYLRSGILPKVLERELRASAPARATAPAASGRGLDWTAVKQAAAERFRQQRGA